MLPSRTAHVTDRFTAFCNQQMALNGQLETLLEAYGIEFPPPPGFVGGPVYGFLSSIEFQLETAENHMERTKVLVGCFERTIFGEPEPPPAPVPLAELLYKDPRETATKALEESGLLPEGFLRDDDMSPEAASPVETTSDPHERWDMAELNRVAPL